MSKSYKVIFKLKQIKTGLIIIEVKTSLILFISRIRKKYLLLMYFIFHLHIIQHKLPSLIIYLNIHGF